MEISVKFYTIPMIKAEVEGRKIMGDCYTR